MSCGYWSIETVSISLLDGTPRNREPINHSLGISLHHELVVGSGGKHEVGHRHLALGIESLDAATVYKDAELPYLAISGRRGHYGEGIAELHIATAAAIHVESFLFGIVGHHHPLSMSIAQHDLGITLECHNNFTGLSRRTHALATGSIILLGRHHAAISLAFVLEEAEITDNGIGRAELPGRAPPRTRV